MQRTFLVLLVPVFDKFFLYLIELQSIYLETILDLNFKIRSYRCVQSFIFCECDLMSLFHSNLMSQGGNMERRDVGDSAAVSSKLSDMHNAIESLTHSVNSVATKQQVRIPTF